MKLLIKFEADWADEMTIYGFGIMTDEQWAWKNLELKHTQFPQEVDFGTNESEVYETLDEYLRNFKITEISDEEAMVINKLFRSDYGQFAIIEGDAPSEFYKKYGYYPK